MAGMEENMDIAWELGSGRRPEAQRAPSYIFLPVRRRLKRDGILTEKMMAAS